MISPTVSTTLAIEYLPVLEMSQIDQFARLGFLVLPEFLPGDLVARLKPETDRWVDDGLRALPIACAVEPETYGRTPVMELEMRAHGELVGHPPLMVADGAGSPGATGRTADDVRACAAPGHGPCLRTVTAATPGVPRRHRGETP
ncbi:hypothetical protein AB0M95_38380 [Sphaerisporangium sp. NPDC051017]|uniref:hypothetical protein n=1 Tax=Sphaerisporangium sp. NPDC051017 TaxID=3154636 RepID=UPI00341E90A8